MLPPLPPPMKVKGESGEIDENGLQLDVDMSFADDKSQWSCVHMNATVHCERIPANKGGCPQDFDNALQICV